MVTSILEECNVVPSTDAPVDQSLPLLHFDMIFLRSCPIRFHNLIFFEIPCSKRDFQETILPRLQASLSLILKHYLPYAGRILFPLSPSGKPASRYSPGDSVSLTVVESSEDFNYLTGNHSRNADEFYAFLAQMPQPDCCLDFIKIPVLALQVTLFPICIGFNINHAIGDGATALQFFQAWAHVTKFDDLPENDLPFHDRTGVEDPNGLDLTFRVTLVLSEAEIGKLENVVTENRPDLDPVSSFTVVTALLWICSVKSGREEVSDNEPEYFSFPVECRMRLSPSLPSTYFGNCVVIAETESTHGRLKQHDGFLCAVQKIKEAISKNLNKEKGILDGLKTWYPDFLSGDEKWEAHISGSPRFDYYGVDFGWGRAKKVECLRGSAISLSRSKDGGIEIGFSLGKTETGYFIALFNKALGKEQEHCV